VCRPARPGGRIEVANVLRDHSAKLSLTTDQAWAVRALVACRTSALGGHLQACDTCGYSRPAYNSCRNRHCPKCQILKQELWAEAQESRLLPTGYFHVVFTVPSELHPLFHREPRTCLDLLFEAVAETLSEVAWRRLEARVGFTAVLHTWTQTLLYHPHVHCIVPGGGLSGDRSAWVASDENFFLPVRVLRVVFRGKLLSKLRGVLDDGRFAIVAGRGKAMLEAASRRTWVVYAKAPMAGPGHVVRYISRYTHRIAIANSRLLAYDGNSVTFSWRDRADGNRRKKIRVEAVAFARRFLWHVLPRRLVRIRHYGLLSNRARKDLDRCRALLAGGAVSTPPVHDDEDWVARCRRIFGRDPLACPACESGRMIAVEAILPAAESGTHAPRPPP
jgi:hypothetical protein